MKRRNEVLVGLLLTVVTVIAVTGTIWLVRGGLSRGYPLYARFPWGSGLKEGQPVRLAGVQVGVVSRAELDPRGTIVVTMSIQSKYQVPENSTARVEAVGFFGDQEIQLWPSRPNLTAFFDPGDTVPAAPPKPGIEALTARADTISQRVDDVARTIQVEMVNRGGIADLRQTLQSTHQLVRQLNDIAEQQSRELTLTTRSLRRTAMALDSASVDSVVQNLQATSQNLTMLTNDLRTTTARLNTVLAKVDSGNGTAARLLNDPGLYNDLRALTQHLDSLTADFKAHPRKYINLEIF